MKIFPHSLFYSLLILVPDHLLQGQETVPPIEPPATEEDAALEKARALFPAFQQTMLEDEEAAQAAFEPFLELPDEMQKRLQVWLDAQWTQKRQAYQRSVVGGNLAPDLKEKIAKDRITLADIRAMKDEKAMKKELEEKGWPAMQSLLKATKRSGATSGGGQVVQSEESTQLLKDALRVGKFRYAIRKNRGEAAAKPHMELGVADPDNQQSDEEIPIMDSMTMDRRNQSILEKNKDLENKIPRAEFEGILEVNRWRIAAGLNALLIDPLLCDAARDHCKDMESLDFFAHDSPVKGKKKPWDRAEKFGTTANAENIAINNSPEDANFAWFHSPGHHKNMFSEQYTHIGFGAHNRHFTQLFR